MADTLRFPQEQYSVQEFCVDGQPFAVRAWMDLSYCARPADDIQRLHLFAPECFFAGESLNGYTAGTAPIFLPNLVGGYMPGPAAAPALNQEGKPNTVLSALRHGYVVACAGIRGRSSAGNTGKAPALIVDLKAAIRYLRFNRGRIPGCTERMITSGTSAGGALSALAGAGGNLPDYQPWLSAIGAAQERDDVFAANCYCPIINLENADPAYEWQFCEELFYRGWTGEGVMNPEQAALARQLKALFPDYLNGLGLRDEDGVPLTLKEDGSGSFLDHVCRWLIRSAQRALDEGRLDAAAAPYLRVQDGRVLSVDWAGYAHAVTRMKTPPAFDALDLSSPENDVFGHAHFTAFGCAHSRENGAMAAEDAVRLINPMRLLGSGTAKHWRIRHGSCDRDTSLAIPVMLAAALRMHGCQVDFHLPWGVPHSGDYDLPDLFAWIDGLCR